MPASGRPLTPYLVLGDDRDGGAEGRRQLRLEQQRHLDHGDVRIGWERHQPTADPFPHQRVDLVLEPGQLLGIGEDDLADPVAIDLAVGSHVGSPALDQASQQRLGVEQLVDHGVARKSRGAQS
jgi:hypothetical protein